MTNLHSTARNTLVGLAIFAASLISDSTVAAVDVLPPTFAAAVPYAVGHHASFVATGDFNRDGALDLVTVDDQCNRATHNTVNVLLGNGNGSFQAPTSSSVVGVGCWSFGTVGDLDGDGSLDLVVANNGFSQLPVEGSLSVVLGNGDGTFQTATNYDVGLFPGQPAIGDYNGDGKLDLAVPNNAERVKDNVGILLGNGDGSFQPIVNYVVGGDPLYVTAGDFDQDGVLDLAVSGNSPGEVSVLRGNGDGTFQSAISYPTGLLPRGVVAGDFNADGVLDLAEANANTIGILIGNGDGTFQVPITYPAEGLPIFIAIGDFNGDGTPDLAVTNQSGEGLGVLVGKGDSSFQSIVTFPTSMIPAWVAVGDFNGDGKPDLAASGFFGGGFVNVLLNTTDSPRPPIISSLTATPGVLWPPNHKMVPVSVAVSASDGSAVAPVCQITAVSSSEPITMPGEGDWGITGPRTVRLRAERAGAGKGRVYTITVTCRNASGLSAAKDVTVRVPHDQSK